MSNYQSSVPPVSIGPGDSAFLFGIPNTIVALAATDGLIRTNGVVLATTGAAHNFVPGQDVEIVGPGSDGGFVSPYGFEGHYVIQTVPTTTTFTYNDPQKPNDNGDGGSAISVAAEQPVLPQAGLQAAITNPRGSTTPPSVTAEIFFTANAAAFTVLFQEADTDVDGNYITPAAAAYTVTGTTALVARVDLSPTGGRFLRPKLTVRTNAVGIVVKITSLA
jgi:hypothetical protein